MFKELKKFQAELDRYHDVNYVSKVEIDCAKAKGELISYKMSSKKFNEYTRKINDLNQMISKMKKELFAHQESISIMSQEKEAQKKFYKTREDKKIEKVIALENKFKVLDDILYRTGQSVQTINMLNRNCKTSFVKHEFLKKAQRVNPRLYNIAPFIENTIEGNFSPQICAVLVDLEKFHLCLKEEMVDENNSLKHEMNGILGVYTKLDEVTNLQCDYLEVLEKCERLEKELSKITENVNNKSFNELSKRFSELKQHSINLEIALQQSTVKFRNDQIALILGYGDLDQGNITITRVYYVEAEGSFGALRINTATQA
ncbi:hypothetical protein Tco_0887151 [Tanacetum coccineum]